MQRSTQGTKYYRYPSPNRLLKGYWTLSSAPFFPILRASNLCQSNCPKKMNYLFYCGSNEFNHPDSTVYFQAPNSQNFFFGYAFTSRCYKNIIKRILAGSRFNTLYAQILQQNPMNNRIWSQVLRSEINAEYGGNFSLQTFNDLQRFFSRL